MTHRIVGLTTEDNEWDYFNDWESWDQRDRDLGYCTESYIARVANINDSIPDEMVEKLREQAIDEIIRINKGIIPYKKVYGTVESYA